MTENNKKTLLDIGLDVNSVMEVLIPRESKIPFEFECEFSIKNSSYISLYEGNRFYVKDNHMIGTYEIPLKGNHLFQLKIDEINRLKVYIDEEQVDTIYCFKTQQIIDIDENIKKQENEMRLFEKSKKEYSDYIQSSLSSIDELDILDNQTKKYLIDKLNWAKDVLNVDDVTTEEYRLALREIEGIINPILKKYMDKPMINEYVSEM